jgi:hypothetical protein
MLERALLPALKALSQEQWVLLVLQMLPALLAAWSPLAAQVQQRREALQAS